MRRLPVLLVLPLVAACATGRGALPAVNGQPSTVNGQLVPVDTTWYVTNRARQGFAFSRTAADSLEFGFVVTRHREHAALEAHFLEAVNSEPVDTVRLSRQEFSERLRARDSVAASTGDGTVMYVHGYAVSFGHAIKQASDIQHRGTFRGLMVAFAWPANANLLNSAVVSRAYREDRATALRSQSAFREAVDVVRRAVRPGALTIVGHSLGSELMSEGLAAASALRDSLAVAPLGAIVLFAADLGITRFRDSLAAPLKSVASRRIVYSSDDDMLMGLSKRMNREERVGQATAARTLASLGVEVVDVTLGMRARHGLRRIYEPGHAMRNASAALYDFFGVVRGVPAECRAAVGMASRDEDGSWRLSDAPLPGGLPAVPADPASCVPAK